MPTFAAVSWSYFLRTRDNGQWMLPVAGSGMTWSAINNARKPNSDSGFLSFGLVILLALLERENILGFEIAKWAEAASCILVAGNFGLPLLTQLGKKLVEKNVRSPEWKRVFELYCASSVVFWAVAAGFTATRTVKLTTSE